MEKKGQMKLSFGMIFSIILIIAFLAFAFYGIQKLMAFQEQAKIVQFTEDFQRDLDRIHIATFASEEIKYSFPSAISSICIIDEDYSNFIFKSKKLFDEKTFQHIDLEKTLDGRTSLCFEVVEGKVTLLLEKNYGEPQIKVSEVKSEF